MSRSVGPLSGIPADRTLGASRSSDYAEDTIGFGEVELRTARDLLLRPRRVLDAYLEFGLTGGGRYTRPLRFFLGVQGVNMFFLFLAGGLGSLVADLPSEDLARLAAHAGKSPDAFMNDAEGWFSIVLVPAMAVLGALCVAPLLRRWMPSDPRAAFALFSASSVPSLALNALHFFPEMRIAGSMIGSAVLVLTFLRMGRGRWWADRGQAIVRSAVLLTVYWLANILAIVPTLGLAVLGGLYGP